MKKGKTLSELTDYELWEEIGESIRDKELHELRNMLEKIGMKFRKSGTSAKSIL